MSNIYSTQEITFDYEDGSVIRARVRIDRKELGKLVWKAAKNKNKQGKRGPVIVSADTLVIGTK